MNLLKLAFPILLTLGATMAHAKPTDEAELVSKVGTKIEVADLYLSKAEKLLHTPDMDVDELVQVMCESNRALADAIDIVKSNNSILNSNVADELKARFKVGKLLLNSVQSVIPEKSTQYKC